MDDDPGLTIELTARENGWWEALRDRDWAAARSFMHDDFSITTAGWIDAPVGADEWLRSLAGRYRLEQFDYDEVTVRRYGDVSVVQCRSHQGGTMLETGERWAESFRYTDVWILDVGGWKIAVRHAGMRKRSASASAT